MNHCCCLITNMCVYCQWQTRIPENITAINSVIRKFRAFDENALFLFTIYAFATEFY